ncbi:enoyl-CoA hydratase/isomerase family protein [Francisella sp. 19X1-34]|uniref:enoyl-CoA hydratase/isomerase family protein n=1 Tax=Francisella sp. 19X1-34 TaxID=3087177 RepID=UPI002E36D3B3|nr:enoyl-CoA hydratase/isomerase family protein [Francisella sp. 19X1-34]MED7789260.1 enoyl-CoA hydratase/isomerase family protein [Francisella sp. 19X1-34]
MDKILVVHHLSKITEIILNNPNKRNAFDKEMSREVIKAITEAEKKNQRVIIIKGNIAHGIFSAGHDLNELTSVSDINNDPMFEMFDAVFNCGIPIIAQVEGDVYAGALHLLMVCDMVYALDDVSVVITANKMGVPFELRDYQKWLSIMGAHKVKELFFTADKITARDAYNTGIFNSIYMTKSDLASKINEVCKSIIDCNKAGITNSKKQLNSIVSNITLKKPKIDEIDKDRKNILASDEFKIRVKNLISKVHKKY